MEMRGATDQNLGSGGGRPGHTKSGFSLIELLVVMVVIAVLLSLLFPVFSGVQERAKKVQARNDLTQIVTAVNAYETEYGKYPLPTAFSGAEYDVGGASGSSTKGLFDALRGLDPLSNPRQIVFINPPDAKDPARPRAGMASAADGQFYDPWGRPYAIRIDADYNETVTNPYGNNNGAGVDPLRQSIIAWSLGKDGVAGSRGNNRFAGSDDVISWQ
jgi:prepilin-type N-terminal cleavage/methylation domain-containing protein